LAQDFQQSRPALPHPSPDRDYSTERALARRNAAEVLHLSCIQRTDTEVFAPTKFSKREAPLARCAWRLLRNFRKFSISLYRDAYGTISDIEGDNPRETPARRLGLAWLSTILIAGSLSQTNAIWTILFLFFLLYMYIPFVHIYDKLSNLGQIDLGFVFSSFFKSFLIDESISARSLIIMDEDLYLQSNLLCFIADCADHRVRITSSLLQHEKFLISAMLRSTSYRSRKSQRSRLDTCSRD